MTPRAIRIAVLCSFNLDLLERPLKEALSRAGVNAELYFTGYGLWEAESLGLQSQLYQFAPDVVLLFADSADLLPPFAPENSLPLLAAADSLGNAAWTRVSTVVAGANHVLGS
jgi:predicted enzyme involved in methoxymalonyl-ACP biosynthesis